MTTVASILDLIGGTPIVSLSRLAPAGIRLYAKLESANPGGSVKDRMAFAIIDDARRSGRLSPGQTVVEATSGNTGIALAMVCAALGHPLVIVMAESFSVERRRLMRRYGARVVLTPASLKGSGMVAKARELAAAHGWFHCDQFENPANVDVHVRTTAREIIDAFRGERLDWFVTGAGTGGTLAGVARVLRRERPDCSIALCEPDNAALIASGLTVSEGSHPAFRPHPIQGWSPDFIPALLETARRDGAIDRMLGIDGDEALDCARKLASVEGILAGISSGATLAGALQVCRTLPAGGTVLCMLPDTGERYLSTPLFADIAEDMNDAEWSISRSTPGARFDAPSPAPAPVTADAKTIPVAANPADSSRIRQLLDEPGEPVVVFGLSWCEFTWSLRRLLEGLNVEYRRIDLDTGDYRDPESAAAMRRQLAAATGQPTLPQLFVAGECVGGCMDAIDSCRRGELQTRFQAHGIAYETAADLSLDTLLPRWVQKRP